jgi:hypothetical protein
LRHPETNTKKWTYYVVDFVGLVGILAARVSHRLQASDCGLKPRSFGERVERYTFSPVTAKMIAGLVKGGTRSASAESAWVIQVLVCQRISRVSSVFR